MKSNSETWTQSEVISLCKIIEKVCPPYGCHVALTGGLLYKEGHRKDADILFYRIRQIEKIDIDGLMSELAGIGIEPCDDFGWCYKATFFGKKIDFFFPEREGDYYPAEADDSHLDFVEAANV